jgi:hypothetical protein
MTNQPLKLSMEDIEKMLPEELGFILLQDPHGHTKSGEPCADWVLSKENALKLIKAYCDQRLLDILNIKIQLKKQNRAEREELFYDHRTNRIYKRAANNYRQYPDLPSFPKSFQDRPETTSEEEGIPF